MTAKVKRGDRRLANEVETAKILGVSPNTLKVARSTQLGDFASLRWYKIGPFVRYDLDHLFEVWLPARQRGGDWAA